MATPKIPNMSKIRNNANDKPESPLRIPGNLVSPTTQSNDYDILTERNNVNDRPESPLKFNINIPVTNSDSQTNEPENEVEVTEPEVTEPEVTEPAVTEPHLTESVELTKPEKVNANSQTNLPNPEEPKPEKPKPEPEKPKPEPEIPLTGATFVRFGEEKIGDAVFEVSGIKHDIITGGLGFKGINEFSERFSPDIGRLPDMKRIMIKYWKITHAMKRNMISEPEEGKFRVPCDKPDIDLLIEAFTNYKGFMEHQVKMNPETTVEDASTIQVNRIILYLSLLKKGPNQPNCIRPTVTDNRVLYYSVLPKIFYLMYKTGDSGMELDIQNIFSKYPTIKQEVSELLTELTDMGPFKKDHDGVRAMAHSVVDLFNLLSKLFPDIYGKIDKPIGSSDELDTLRADLQRALEEIARINAELAKSAGKDDEINRLKADLEAALADATKCNEALEAALAELAKAKKDLAEVSTIEDVDVESILKPYLEFIKDPVLISGIIDNIKGAHTDYKSKDTTAAINKIGKAFALFKQIVDELEKKVASASTTTVEPAVPEPVQVQSAPESNLVDMKSIIKQIASILKSGIETDKIKEELNKVDLSGLNSEEQLDVKTLIDALVPNAESCKPFIQDAVKSARQELYKQIIGHVRSMFDRLSIPLENMKLPSIDANGDAMRGTDVFEKLNGNISDVYDNNEPRIAYQRGMISIDDAIDTLGEYLIELENKYTCWKKCFEKQPAAKPAPAPQPAPAPFVPFLKEQPPAPKPAPAPQPAPAPFVPFLKEQPPAPKPFVPFLKEQPPAPKPFVPFLKEQPPAPKQPIIAPTPPPATTARELRGKYIYGDKYPTPSVDINYSRSDPVPVKPKAKLKNTSGWNSSGPDGSAWNTNIGKDQLFKGSLSPKQLPPGPKLDLKKKIDPYTGKPYKYIKGGSRDDVAVGPDDIIPVMAEQYAWENMMKAYNDLEPEYQKMLPPAEPAPIYKLTEPIHRYIDEYADEDPLEEARDTIGMMSPEEIEDVFVNDEGAIDRIKPLFKMALSNTNEEWIPVMIRAEILRVLPSKNYMYLSSS
jgi:hypothetical protein